MDIIKLSLKRPIFITMIACFLVAVGVIALTRLPVDLYPDTSYPVLSVRASLSGAAPEEMEQLVTKPLEDELSTIAGVQLMRSISREGMSIVNLEFDPKVDVRFEEIQVRAKVANLKPRLPEDLGEPVVQRQDPDDTPIIELSVTGDRSAAELTTIAEDQIALRLRQISGVGSVDLGGDRKPEIKVDLRREALDQFKLSATAVVNAIRDFNRNDPVGKLEGKERAWVLRSLTRMRSTADIALIPVATDGQGEPVFLGDVATIESGFEEIRNISRVGNGKTLLATITMDILKQSGENTLEISDRIHKTIAELQKELPGDVKITVTRDNADLVRTNVADVQESIVIGAILTILVVLLFLHSPRSTLTTGLALPTSVITTFAAMAIFGFTINVMTLLAISLAVGLLVDDAIVVRENIFRHLHEGKMNPVEAAHKGTHEVILAVVATTMTVVAVFVPVAFMGGVSGQLFRQFALTVVFAMLVSLWDAITMAPMLSAYYANYADPAQEWAKWGRFGGRMYRSLMVFEHWFDSLAKAYGRLLRWLLPKPLVASGLTALAAALAIACFFGVKKSFLPSQLGDTFQVNLSGPLAVPMQAIDKTALEAEQKLRKVDGLQEWTVRSSAGFNGAANIRFTVRIKPESARNQTMLADLRSKVRQTLSGFPGYVTRVSEPADPMAGGAGRFQPVAVIVAGDDIERIRDISQQVRQMMVDTPGVTDVGTIDDQGLPEVRVYTDPALAAQYGGSPQAIGDALRIWVDGNISNSLRLGDDQIPIRVRLQGAKELPPNELIAQSMHLRSPKTMKDVTVPVANMVSWETGAGAPIIVRENRQRTVRIGANLAPGAALGDVTGDLGARLKGLPLPTGYSARLTGQSDQMNELTGNVLWALILGSIFVYMVLASLFESFTQPITVMAAIPLAATGAMMALWMFDSPLDLYSGIGLVLLAGIVAKNSILLVDFAMQRVRDVGMPANEAILDSAPLRLRPIIMTSLAMIAGMIPVATGWGAGGQARMSLGIATIGGVISSTLLTLLVVPNLYVAVEAFNGWYKKRFMNKVPH